MKASHIALFITLLSFQSPPKVEAFLIAPTKAESLNDFIRRLGKIDPTPVGSIPIPGAPTPPSVFTGRQRCDHSPRRETAEFSQLAAFAPNAQSLWPGSIITGSSTANGLLTPIALPRAKGTIVVTDIGFAKAASHSAKVEEPRLDTVNDALQRLMPTITPAATPAAISHEVQQFYSLQHAFLQLNAQYSWLTGKVQASLSSDKYLNSNNMMLKFVQTYYNVSFLPPAESKDFFHKKVHAKDLAPFVQLEDNKPSPPMYVSTVTYGRMLLLFASSQKSLSELKATLEAVYKSATSKGEIKLTAEQQEVLSQSELRLLAIGGASEPVTKLLSATTVIGDLTHYFESGANFSVLSPGVPISYKVSYLTNEPAKVSLTTDYVTRDCNPQKIVACGVRFETTEENKDKGDTVSGRVYYGGDVAWEWVEFGRKHHEWDEWTSQPEPSDAEFGRSGWFFKGILPGKDIPISNCKSLSLGIFKDGKRSWHFKTFLGVQLEDGTFFDHIVNGQEGKLGTDDDGNGGNQIFSPDGC